jgi:CoA-dependent NAD(P)H sulfur oxidoreductase
MKKKVIVIGGGAGGMTCAVQLRKMNKELDITLIEKGEYVSWAGCPTPYFIAGELPFKSVVHYQPDYFEKELNIKIEVNCKAERVDFDSKIVEILKNSQRESIYYDILVLSCGSTPIIPNIENLRDSTDGIFRLSNGEDAVKIKKFITEKEPVNAVVVGTGFIGIEMIESFRKLNMSVTAIEKADEILPFLSEKLKAPFIKKMEEKGVRIITGSGVKKVIYNSNNTVIAVVLDSGEEIKTDILLLSIGIKPNIELLNNSGFKFTDKNRVITDKYMRTYIEGVYAIGDMIYIKNSIKGIYENVALGDVADKQAIIAAANICGEKREYKGVNGSSATSFFEIKTAKTGITLKEAEQLGYKAKYINLKVFTKNPGFSDSKKAEIEVVYDEEDGVVLGAVMVGYESVAQFIDIFSIVIYKKIRIEEFIDFDFCYSPTNSTVWNPLLALYRKYMKAED